MLTLNRNDFTFNDKFLPALVFGKDGSGASNLSIVLASQLINSGVRVVFFTAFPMAKEKLRENVDKERLFEINEPDDFELIPASRSLVVNSGDLELLHELMSHLGNEEYVLFVKNIEEYSNEILGKYGQRRKIIVSGNIDALDSPEEVLERDWITTIQMGESEASPTKLPELQKYEAYLVSEYGKGILRNS